MPNGLQGGCSTSREEATDVVSRLLPVAYVKAERSRHRGRGYCVAQIHGLTTNLLTDNGARMVNGVHKE